MVDLGHISTDGTKIKANASNNYTLSKEEIEEIRKIIERGIAIDEEEDRLYGDKKLDKAEKELNRSGQSAVSITDPEARFMKNKKSELNCHTTRKSP